MTVPPRAPTVTPSPPPRPRTRALRAAFAIVAAGGLACGDIEDPRPCGVGEDPTPCVCDLAAEGGVVQGIALSVPHAGFDALHVRVTGPATREFQATLGAGGWTGSVHDLPPGTYRLVVQGTLGGETDYYGLREGVVIEACAPVRAVSIAVGPFRPVVQSLAADGLAVAASWAAVQQADRYIVELDTSYAFAAPTRITTTETAVVLPVDVPGRYVVRIRAGNADVAEGRPSSAGFMVLSDAATMTTDALMAHIAYLADDSLYGRQAGCVHERRAAQYVRGWMTRIGLAAGTPGYFQEFDAASGSPASSPWWRCLPGRSQNVLGVLPGEGALADEWVVIGAHYDHAGWRLDGPDSTLVIYNGADDNASGTSALIETARQLSEWVQAGDIAGSRRSLLFQGFGAEEVGLVGSWHFVAPPTVALDRIVAMVNLDMVGRLRDNQLTVATDTVNAWWEAMVGDVNDEALALSFDHFAGSDDLPFAAVGIPTVFFFTDFHADYHKPTDDPDKINAEGLRSIAALTTRVVRTLATQEGVSTGTR